MTETLHRPTSNPEQESSAIETSELEAKMALEYDQDDEVHTKTVEQVSTDISPIATRIRNAAERIANRLERRAINRAHDEALDFMRKTDNAGYVDHVAELAENGETEETRHANQDLLDKEHRRADREAKIEAGKRKLKYLGALATSAAVETGKTVGNTAKGVGMAAKSEAVYRINDARLKHSNEKLTNKFHKTREKELKRFDKQAADDRFKVEKTNRKEMKRAIRADKRFERSMRNKVRIENAKAKIERGTAKAMDTVERGAVRVVYTKLRIGGAAIRFQDIGRGNTEYVPRAKRSVK